MPMVPMLTVRPQEPAPLAAVPILTISEFRVGVLAAVVADARLAALFGRSADGNTVQLIAVLAQSDGKLAVLSTAVSDTYPALTPDCPQAHWFERELAEQWGVRPDGHPWLKPIRFHRSSRPDCRVWDESTDASLLPGVTNFFQVQGTEVHEVAVGPVHAGVIEPGHFRFQCHGETVLHLEISLGYQHRGVERALVGGPNKR